MAIIHQPPLHTPYRSVNRAFSKQSSYFDQEDLDNPVLQYMRQQVRSHVQRFLKPEHHILEINAGTGLDAVYFANRGNKVYATDLSDGMIQHLNKKIEAQHLQAKITVQQLSYTELHKVESKAFDYVFSNFGGLNCTDDLAEVTRHLPGILKNGAFITLVIMPSACPWEWLSLFKGNFRHAFRRLNSRGSYAHLEGESFPTFYHSLKAVQKAMGRSFDLLKVEGLGAIIPPPEKKKLMERFPGLFLVLKKMDEIFRNHYPFNRWADHIIITFRYMPA